MLDSPSAETEGSENIEPSRSGIGRVDVVLLCSSCGCICKGSSDLHSGKPGAQDQSRVVVNNSKQKGWGLFQYFRF